jgi:hypothetical protein
MESIKERVTRLIRRTLSTHKNIKVNLELECAFRNLGRQMIHNFHLKNIVLKEQDDLEEFWTNKQKGFIYSKM